MHNSSLFDCIIHTTSTNRTPLSFFSSNSSFIECVRKHYSPSFSLSYSSLANNNCDDSPYQSCTYDSDTLPALSTTTTKFISCTFTWLTSTYDGGALSLTDSNQQLHITDSSFTSCVSSSGFGGAIYAYEILSFSVEKTPFFDCNCTEKDGGGLYFESSLCYPLISDTSFLSCYARTNRDSRESIDDGGGITITCSFPSTELHYILQSCRFISCRCYDWGAGGALDVSSSVVGCADSLFSSCYCSLASALGISLITADAEFLIFFCCFIDNTGTSIPSDISFNRNAGEFSDSPFFHSFSTKDPSDSVTTCESWQNYQYRNWLPQGVIKHVNQRAIKLIHTVSVSIFHSTIFTIDDLRRL